MRIQEVGQEIRKARMARGMTQAELASAVGISRPTLNLLESGLIRDLGLRKVLAVLNCVGLELNWQQGGRPRRPDYVRMACTSANVSFKSTLSEDELIRALITGRVPGGRSAHLRLLLDEAPTTLLRGLAEDAGRWTKPGKLQKNLARIAHDTGATRRIDEWLKTD